jgi:hypothetical protein
MAVIATCTCGQKNRLKPGTRQCCGKCRREFTPREIMLASLGERPDVQPMPPEIPEGGFDGEDGDDELEPEFCDEHPKSRICTDCGCCHKCEGSCADAC